VHSVVKSFSFRYWARCRDDLFGPSSFSQSGLLNFCRLAYDHETISVSGFQKLTYSSCVDTSKAFDRDVLGSLRRASLVGITKARRSTRLLWFCFIRFDCWPNYCSGLFAGSPSVILSSAALPAGKMPQIRPRLCLETRHSVWIRRERHLFIQMPLRRHVHS
jgi:hypothetical protein